MTHLLDHRQLDELESTQTRPHSQAISRLAEVMLRRSAHLAKEDRTMIELLLRGHLSHRRIAAVMAMPPGTVSRRLKRLASLLRDPLIARLLDGPCPLDRLDRQIAVGYFLHRKPLRELAGEYQQSIPQISRRLQFVRGWFRGASVRAIAE